MIFFKFMAHILTWAILTIIFLIGLTRIPESYKPWIPIDLNHEINFLTPYKIFLLSSDFELCKSVLTDAGVKFTPLPNSTEGQCELNNQIYLERSLYPYSAPVKGQCSLIVSLALWERHAVTRAAVQELSSEIESIEHFGIFSCRNIANSNRKSQHASANAIDISAFHLKDGTSITIRKNWLDNDAKGRFLRSVKEKSCSIFSSVLSPDYNRAHEDHFHLDNGPYSICR